MIKVLKIKDLTVEILLPILTTSEKPLFFDTTPDDSLLIISDVEITDETVKLETAEVEKDTSDLIINQDEPVFETGEDYSDDDILFMTR